ncbi:MAG: nitrite reductase, copper-containing [Candidatus Doudnabacteria bacterium RIFCSPHIGHO2_02_FULL_48_21]|uniref:Copper-containing nitrite reductase n=1 Tax=Candidatus Doudnabacteria bacterium RIFCSPLOWO2_02_FULL_48_13 TaxID=1817845 RepID=A0A1F5Q8R7_9BACT|nr:MAG: nitrite reductase, copper-containing [Candidatus Doudnabacteria bacterium RIFCSPHIGHO2_01_48_18]OGE79926.1 MAG: nitrite reductase, copper-containing [Candidatus Doudnabacteria bacterium RIFCSPHIGHO2_01_FULL_48_180]OGE93958.1 MAG: nitrite reductase, copper-containing [Candidatus Doudnabacteria bacterium RIFCSPHIGHO2_02_FULL_48_21]OGE97203.1 MAG: nitrite reductase, copper-containing [Candidatus Doudnabacteria bacterium RIFCSPLOWO2_01_FULL_48_57]OGE98507.1 MAG: nitrite reductase, copper-co
MLELFSLIKYVFFQIFGLIVAVVAGAVFVFPMLRKLHSRKTTILLFTIFFGISLFFFAPRAALHAIQYPFFLKTFGPADGPALPLKNVINFFFTSKNIEHIPDITRDPNDIPPPVGRQESQTVEISLEAKEVIGEMATGVFFNYWTFNGTVPGPFLRVREGDTVKLTLKNHPSSINPHNIDLHAVTGPGGGAAVTNIAPGESKTVTFKAINPGLYAYHCAHPNVAAHDAHGMYGLILVEPKDGLPKVDKEFYVMQGEFYSTGALGDKGLQIFDAQKMLDGKPEYVVFNGRVGGLNDKMKARVGEKIRVFVGNGGVNLISSFHVIGEIFDDVYPEGSIGGAMFKNVQTTLVPAGGAAIVEFGTEVPGKYIFVDHALSRLDRGAWGILELVGEPNREVFDGVFDDKNKSSTFLSGYCTPQEGYIEPFIPAASCGVFWKVLDKGH